MDRLEQPTIRLLQTQRDAILKLAEEHGAQNVRVFGSVVRGEDTANSDIDLLVDLGETLSAWFPTGLIHDLEALLGRKVDIVTAQSLHYYLRDKVLKEAQPL
ncbi:MAG: nucleotidyltransferase family protein [Leptolyngbya sp. RL_3_1]|nr:nucleotidyltransferase family protein [Leptolyngbya sp. RL_3_1]